MCQVLAPPRRRSGSVERRPAAVAPAPGAPLRSGRPLSAPDRSGGGRGSCAPWRGCRRPPSSTSFPSGSSSGRRRPSRQLSSAQTFRRAQVPSSADSPMIASSSAIARSRPPAAGTSRGAPSASKRARSSAPRGSVVERAHRVARIAAVGALLEQRSQALAERARLLEVAVAEPLAGRDQPARPTASRRAPPGPRARRRRPRCHRC